MKDTAQFLVERPCKQATSGYSVDHLMPFIILVEFPGEPNQDAGHGCKSKILYRCAEDNQSLRTRLGIPRTVKMNAHGVVCENMGRLLP
jgi:hypothetical protein